MTDCILFAAGWALLSFPLASLAGRCIAAGSQTTAGPTRLAEDESDQRSQQYPTRK